MAKIQPFPSSPCSTSSPGVQQGRHAYTVWMKSLVFNGNGCAVYGPDGAVAFRVDNYGSRGGREVLFMDRAGNALIRIRGKGVGMFRRWEVSRCAKDGGQDEEATQWFSVRRAEKGEAAVAMHGGAGTCYTIEGCCARKPEYKIRDVDSTVVAEVARKQTAAGVVLGEDVLTLTVGPKVDHLLVLGLVVVRGLMNRSL
ncbi:protein LURP-one-related 11-like [Triticum dicoccoides]|uniref:protein LURP-one-related 11-like n=1 Tax=Triticum dicoccoides TaxID=85692 RepID=UPI0003D504D0|nr:protein LURP-one-related 11-like [Triticum dicoccoides]XP_044345361.1 protein LURP-one-related 11-like [Triticum aestivum]